MKMGSFLLGSAIGAAAAIYLSKRRNPLLSGFTLRSSSKQSSDTSKADLSQVEQMIHEDPELQHTVNEIMQDGSGQQH